MRRRKPNAALESSIFRTEGKVCSQVPFAKDARGVTGVAEHISHRRNVRSQQRAATTDVDTSIACRIQPRQQLPSGWGTHRRDMKVRKSQTLFVQRVEVRRLQNRVAMRREFGVALIIGHDNHDVGPLGECLRSKRQNASETNDEREPFHVLGLNGSDSMAVTQAANLLPVTASCESWQTVSRDTRRA